MMMTLAISLFFGIAAALALSVVFVSLKRACAQYRAIQAELTALDGSARVIARLHPQAARARTLVA